MPRWRVRSQHRVALGVLSASATSLLVLVSRQELASECEASTHCLLLGDPRAKQTKIMLPP